MRNPLFSANENMTAMRWNLRRPNLRRVGAFAALTIAGAGASACGSDDVAGVNACDIVTQVTNVKDSYLVGEVSNVSVSFTTRNSSASCREIVLKKAIKLGTSAPAVASGTPAGQLIAIAPGVATLTWGPDTAQPFSKTITVLAPNPDRP